MHFPFLSRFPFFVGVFFFYLDLLIGTGKKKKKATTFIEQGHVRVGTEVVTDPAYLVTRNMEDFVTWVDSSKIKRNIMRYREKLDDFDLMQG